MTTDDLSMARFEAVKASTFTIEALAADGGVAASVAATLQSVHARGMTGGYEQYAMLFAGPRQPLLTQGTYRFVHAELGALQLFMVPVGQDATGTQYEVCISRKIA